ncbi:inositol monophosphatase [Hyphococcus flavus]|uniref:Inositol monophosphatase n=1 Tax=Hyphococcus flavus TaxID=1866326 RepID=A0AAF0CFD3_9PROT|nr:inositol monophosphatase [Hyphococcus flavus]WDI30793.1 inositol monophosphatase [Hyphococcus flavus]
MIVDPEKVAAVIAEVAEEEIVSRFGALSDDDIGTKSRPDDFVTVADQAAEAQLKTALAGILPGAGFIGEESAARDSSILTKLEGDGAYWIVDPLDGTRNFVQGVREFGSMVALVEKGKIRQGWIYAIPEKAFAIGEAGSGASWNGEALKPVKPSKAPLFGYRAVGALSSDWRGRLVKPLRENFETEPARCSAYAYINLITGERDFALSSRCSPWDHAPGVVILREIGGRAEYLDDGEPYRPVSTFGRPMLVAGNDFAWRTVAGVVLG